MTLFMDLTQKEAKNGNKKKTRTKKKTRAPTANRQKIIVIRIKKRIYKGKHYYTIKTMLQRILWAGVLALFGINCRIFSLSFFSLRFVCVSPGFVGQRDAY